MPDCSVETKNRDNDLYPTGKDWLIPAAVFSIASYPLNIEIIRRSPIVSAVVGSIAGAILIRGIVRCVNRKATLD